MSLESAVVELKIQNGRATKVVVNDQDVLKSVNALRLEVQEGALPTLTLLVDAGDVELAGPGVVVVEQKDEVDCTDLMVEFLDSIDPEMLEAESLSSLGWGSDNGTEAMLDTLKKWARGIR